MDLVFFFTYAFCLFTLPTTVSYIRTFVYPGWVAFFFPGFRAKRFPWLNFHFFYYYYYVNNRGSWDQEEKSRHQKRRKNGESGIKICLRGRTWGSSGGFLFPFSFTLCHGTLTY